MIATGGVYGYLWTCPVRAAITRSALIAMAYKARADMTTLPRGVSAPILL
jgi:hypothetical protein